MSTKSYTLADNSTTVTVNTTANGVEFNEGMGALTKAIKAKITASSGGGASSSSKLEPTLTINLSSTGSYSYSYNGDGYVFACGLGETSINNETKTGSSSAVNSNPGTLVEGVLVMLYATEGEKYASKIVWAETGYFVSSNLQGTIYEFAHSGSF